MGLTFWVNGDKVSLADHEVNPRMTLLEYLREKAIGLTGTKISCGQGGCGACTVMLSQKNASGEIDHCSVNACLRPLLSMAGQMVTTTEGIGNDVDGFHPVQSRIAECNGTQCGFCTPGHVMAMYSLLREQPGASLSPAQIEERFDGTICRCTGYRSIMTACHSFASEGVPGEKEAIAGVAPRDWKEYDHTTEPAPPAELAESSAEGLCISTAGLEWHKPLTLAAVGEIQTAAGDKPLKLLCGNTSTGPWGPDDSTEVFVDISAVAELAGVEMGEAGLVAGSTTTISQLMAALSANAAASASYPVLVDHMKKVANWQVRNVGSWAGNLVMAKTKHFSSDIATLLMGAGATLKILAGGATKEVDVNTFLWESDSMGTDIILSVTIPMLAENEHLLTFRAAQRPNNAHALLNACFRATVDPASKAVSNVVLGFGVADLKATYATAAQDAMNGSTLDMASLTATLAGLESLKMIEETQYHTTMQPEGKDAYRRNLASSFVYKFYLGLLGRSGGEVSAALKSAASVLIEEKGCSTGTQTYETELPADHPGSIPRPKVEAKQQASGQTTYHDDIQVAGQLYAAFVPCTRAPAKVEAIDTAAALAMPGVVAFVDGSDAAFNSASMEPGAEPLFVPVEGETIWIGHPVGCIVAESRREAEAAAKVVAVTYSDPEKPGVYSIDQAVAAESYNIPPGAMEVTKGDPEAAYAAAESGEGMTVSGELKIGGQSHFCMEKQTTVAVPSEQGRMILYVSSQFPDVTRAMTGAISGISGDKLEVIIKRCGGGFGGKLDNSFWNSGAAAVCAKKLRRPVKMQNDISTDMMIGGNCRHPSQIKYKASVDAAGKITSMDVDSTIDGGGAGGFSGFVADEIVKNIESTYHVPHVRSKVAVTKTNTASNTAVRGPGLVQAIAITETIVEHLAGAMKVPSEKVRTENLMDQFNCITTHPTHIRGYNLDTMWKQLTESSEITARRTAVEEFNAANKWKKRGISMVPMRYGLSHGLNAGTTCLVSIHASDGTVDVHHGGTEIGQGLTTKIQQMVAVTLGCDFDKIFVHATNTAVLPNMGITGGSTTSETCCEAARIACEELNSRLARLKDKMTRESEDGKPPAFGPLVAAANQGLTGADVKVNLSCTGQFTPQQDDHTTGGPVNKSDGPTYFGLGAGVSEVEVDVLTGEVAVLRTDLLYDCGQSLNPQIDIGQAEGGFVMGQGFFLQEETMYTKDGMFTSDGTWEYKPLLANQIPTDFRVEFLKDSAFPLGIKGSKAVGEPPLLLSASIFTAVREAVKSSRVERGKSAEFQLDVPASVDRVQRACEVDAADLAL